MYNRAARKAGGKHGCRQGRCGGCRGGEGGCCKGDAGDDALSGLPALGRIGACG